LSALLANRGPGVAVYSVSLSTRNNSGMNDHRRLVYYMFPVSILDQRIKGGVTAGTMCLCSAVTSCGTSSPRELVSAICFVWKLSCYWADIIFCKKERY